MSVTIKKIDDALTECYRFIEKAEQCKAVHAKKRPTSWELFPKETGAVRRASMDLTRSLVDIRK